MTLWTIQVLLALVVLFAGSMKFVLPIEKMQGPIALPGGFMHFIGACEVLGIVVAIAAGRLIRGFLYGLGSGDPLTFVAVALLLGSVALLASYLPARRAMRVDPVLALATQ